MTLFFKKFYAGGGLGEFGYRYKKTFLEKLPLPKCKSYSTSRINNYSNQKPDINNSDITEIICSLYNLSNEEKNFINALLQKK